MRALAGLWGVIATLAVLAASPAKAEIRALLVGESAYASSLIPSLKGPKNDVGAMESLLKSQGAIDVTVLLDAAATRTSVEGAIHDLGERAKPGDWVVLYFSGHGAQAAAAIKGDEDDDLDEFLVLSSFDMKAPDPETYITDNDFRDWIARYIPSSVQVLQVADACHSGTLNRSIDPRAWAFTPRLAFVVDEPIQLARPTPRFAPVTVDQASSATRTGPASDLSNVIYIGAAQDDQLALEASLPAVGAPSRGLLTFSLVGALTTYAVDGKTLAADSDGDGRLSLGELAIYLDGQTRQISGQRQQSSVIFTAGREHDTLFSQPPPRQAAPATASPPSPPAIFGADPVAAKLLAGAPMAVGAAWTAADTAGQADFVWDQGQGVVLRRSGDVVAQDVRSLERLGAVLDAWGVVDGLRPFINEARAKVVIGPRGPGARYAAGEHVRISVEAPAAAAKAPTLGPPTPAPAPLGPSFLTVFNLASDGTVQALYPLVDDGAGALPAGGDGPGFAPRIAPRFDSVVVAPFGADHVVALLTPTRPDDLRAILHAVDGQRAATRLASALREALAKGGAQASLSIGELYTGPDSGPRVIPGR